MYAISYPSGTIYEDGVEVEQRDDNPALQRYLVWLRADGTPEVLRDARTYPSIKVNAWQLIQALSQKGLLETVDAAANASSDVLVRMGWQRAPIFLSNDPLILSLCAALSIGDDARQDVFELAASL